MELWIVAAAESTTAVKSSMAVLAILALVLFLRVAGSGKRRRRRRAEPMSTLRSRPPREMRGRSRGASRHDIAAEDLRERQLERLHAKGTISAEELQRTRDAFEALR